MSLHIVIDGYNLIRQSKHLSAIERSSLQEGREALLERLVSYRHIKHHPMTVVFDGAYADTPLKARDRYKGINVIFSRPGESADTVIKRLVARERERAVVVSSDREVADAAAQHGAATMGSVEFEGKITIATQVDVFSPDLGDEEERGWTPTTKKKGPSRRPSKRMRKSRSKTKKL
jgi:predicted RNA-binding protein with PIN domain